jgi:hypothetical protein
MGDDNIDAKRSRPSIGKIRLCATRAKSASDWLGPDPQITSGPAATAAACKGPYTWLHPTRWLKRQISSCTAARFTLG